MIGTANSESTRTILNLIGITFDMDEGRLERSYGVRNRTELLEECLLEEM